MLQTNMLFDEFTSHASWTYSMQIPFIKASDFQIFGIRFINKDVFYFGCMLLAPPKCAPILKVISSQEVLSNETGFTNDLKKCALCVQKLYNCIISYQAVLETWILYKNYVRYLKRIHYSSRIKPTISIIFSMWNFNISQWILVALAADSPLFWLLN